MKKLIMAIAFLTSSVAMAEFKLGVINMQKAIQATTAGKNAKKELEGDFEKKKKELQKKEADLKKMQEDLERKKSVLSEDVLQKKQVEFQEEMMKFREVVGKNQVEIQKKEQDLTAPIVEKMRRIVEKMAKDKGFSVVLENSAAVLYAETSYDLTDEVTKAFEKDK